MVRSLPMTSCTTCEIVAFIFTISLPKAPNALHERMSRAQMARDERLALVLVYSRA